MNRTKIILAGLLVAMIVLLAAGGYFLARSAAAAREAREQRDAAFSRLAALFQANPFPDAANAARMNNHVQLLGQMRAAMTNALSRRDVLLSDLSPSRFIQELQTALRDRLQASAPIVEGGRVISDGFAFGFDRYVAANAPMPAEADVPRLAQQLVMVEHLVSEVYASQVRALRAIGREEFESADGVAAPGTASAWPRSPARPKASGFYRSQRFRLVVEGRQSTIGDLINRLAAMQLFVVVQDVEMRKQGEDLRPPQAAAPAAPAPGAPSASLFSPPPPPAAVAPAVAAAAAPAEKPVSDLPPSRRLVSGREIDPLIEARIELDVYNFMKEGV